MSRPTSHLTGTQPLSWTNLDIELRHNQLTGKIMEIVTKEEAKNQLKFCTKIHIELILPIMKCKKQLVLKMNTIQLMMLS